MSVSAQSENRQQAKPLSSWWKLQGIFFQPGATFQAIDKNPNWLLPFIITSLVSFARMLIFHNPSTVPFKLVLTFLTAALPCFIPVLVCSGAFFTTFVLFGAETTFKKVFSLLMHTFFFMTAVNVGINLIVLFVVLDFDMVNQENQSLTNLGFLVSAEDNLALNYLLSSIDVIAFYHLYLIGLGLSIVSQKVSFKLSMGLVATLWALYVAAMVVIKTIVA